MFRSIQSVLKFILISEQKKQILNVVRYGVLNSMHPDVRKVAPQNLLNNQAMPIPEVGHLHALKMQRDKMMKQIECEKKKGSAHNSIIGDKIDELNKRLVHVKEAIDRISPDDPTNNDIGTVMRCASVVCSTLSSAINIKP